VGSDTVRVGAGFTLVELLVVLTLLALLLAAVPPVLSAVAPRLQLSATTRALADDLRASRLAAAEDAVETVLTLDLARRRYRHGPDARERALPDGIGIEIVEAAAAERDLDRAGIRFYPDGSSSGGRVAVSHGTRRMFVSVDWLTGRVEIAP
jgi:general secretion pathway protein H